MMKEKDIALMNEEMKVNAFSKMFRHINAGLIERFYKIHSEFVVFDANKCYFTRNISCNFFSEYKVYDELGNISLYILYILSLFRR